MWLAATRGEACHHVSWVRMAGSPAEASCVADVSGTMRQAPSRVFAPGEPSIRLRRQAQAAQRSAFAARPSSPSHDRQHPTVRLRSRTPTRYVTGRPPGSGRGRGHVRPKITRPGGWRLTRRPSAHLLRGWHLDPGASYRASARIIPARTLVARRCGCLGFTKRGLTLSICGQLRSRGN
jgi:hypothetical protein